MNKLILIVPIILALFAMPAFAESIDYCLNDSYAQSNFSADIITDGTAGNISYSTTSYCSEGCSNTLNTCRLDQSGQTVQTVLWIVGIIVLLILSTYMSSYASGIGWSILAISALICLILGGLLDIYSATFRTLFLALTLLPVGYLLVSTQKGGDEDE